MAIITDRELEAGSQVTVRWFARASQRYPAAENEYFSTFYNMLEPNEEFVLTDPAFDLALVNDPDAELEYVIRDVCYVQTLIPQFIGFEYFNPDYITLTSLMEDAEIGDTTIVVASAAGLTTGVNIQIGPIQSDIYMIITIVGTTVTFATALIKDFAQGVTVNQIDIVASYPDLTPENAIGRVFDTSGSELTDPLEVTTPIYYDTSETIRRYYYDSLLETPYNGARGSGMSTNQTLTFEGRTIEGGWWAFGDDDDSAATSSCLIDSLGFVLECRDFRHPFSVDLSRASSEVGACTDLTVRTYFTNHPNFRDAGNTSIVNTDGSSPSVGFYAWTSDIGGDANQRFVKYWNGTAFEINRVGTGFVDNCPLGLTQSVEARTYGSEQELVCDTDRNAGVSRTLFYESTDNTFTAGIVSAIYTNVFGPNSIIDSSLGASFIRAEGINFTWTGSVLSANTASCVMNTFCGDPMALNTGSGDIRDDSLCVYARTICTDPTAIPTSFIPVADRLTTDIIDNSVCVFGDVFVAGYNVTRNIIRPAGITIDEVLPLTLVDDSGEAGDTYNISYTASLRDGWEFVGTTPTNLTATDSGTFSADVVIPVTITGSVQRIAAAPIGCNIATAENFLADSDGTATCYYGPFDIFTGASDNAVCDDFAGSAARRTVFSDTPGGTIGAGKRFFSDFAGTPAGNGWASTDGITAFMISSGVVIEAVTCTVGVRIGTLEIIGRAIEQISVNEQLAAGFVFTRIPSTDTTRLRVTVGGAGVSQGAFLGEGDVQTLDSTSRGTVVVGFNRSGTHRFFIEVRDDVSGELLSRVISDAIEVLGDTGTLPGRGRPVR